MKIPTLLRRLAPKTRRARIAAGIAASLALPLGTGAFALAAFPTAEPVARTVVFLYGAEWMGRQGVAIQQGDSDCGIAALQMALAARGVMPMSLEPARAAAQHDHGTTLLQLKRLAEARGVRAEGWRMDLHALARAPKPALVHLGDHFAVVDHVERDGRVVMRDPSLGRIRVAAEDFNDLWTGDALVFPRPQARPAAAAAGGAR